MPRITYDRYPNFDELTDWLQGFAAEFPELVQLSSIGASYEGHDLWLLTVTNHAIGNPAEKPAIWIDGNIHATEVTASMAIVHLVDTSPTTRSPGSTSGPTPIRPTRRWATTPGGFGWWSRTPVG